MAFALAACFGWGNDGCANPQGAVVVNGQAAISRPDARTLAITNSAGAILNWKSFSIQSGETTRFIQPNAASAVLNRVVGGDPSSIVGMLQSNGRVFLINPNGIVFGAGSVIDTAGLIASTLNMSNADFVAGRMRFAARDGAGNIVNQGVLRAGQNGQILLIAPNIRNEGVIETKDGRIILAAGRKLELTSPELDGIHFEVQAPEDQVVNLGRIDAGGGAAKLFAGTLRHRGTVQANSLARDQAGDIVLVAKRDVDLEAGSRLEASGKTGGRIRVESNSGTTSASGVIEARGQAGTGGGVTLLGNKVSVLGNTTIDVSGDTGGGTVLLGGNLHGQGPERNAAMVDFGASAAINADAKSNGDGGKIVVWADDTASVNGTLTARGGSVSGNGGFIETSAERSLYLSPAAVDASAPRGNGGTWLIDPVDIHIVAGDGEPIGTNNVDAPDINSALNSGLEVILDTSTATGPQGSGDITQNSGATISKTAGGDATLTLRADRNILLNDSITASSGRLNLNVIGDQGGTGAGAVLILGAISTHGGDITISGSNSNGNDPDFFGTAVRIGSVSIAPVINSGGGNISITGTTTSAQGQPLGQGVDRGISIVGPISSGGGKITLTGSHIEQRGIIIFQPIDSAGGDVSFTVTSAPNNSIALASSLQSGSGNVTLTANTIAFIDASALLSGAGDLTLQPFSPTQSIGIGSGDGGFSLTQSDLDRISGFRSVTIGRADGLHDITVADARFSYALTQLRGGSITIGEVGEGSTGLEIIGDVSLVSRDSITQDPGAPIRKTADGDATLTLRANGNILLEDSITASSGRLNLNVLGDQGGTGAGAVDIQGAISTHGGDITISGSNSNGNDPDFFGIGVGIGNASNAPEVNSGGGNISITGTTTSAQGQPLGQPVDRGIDIEGPISSGGGKITLTASHIEQDGIVVFQPIDSAGGDVSFTVTSAPSNRIAFASSLRSGSGNVTLTANTIAFVNASAALGGTGDLALRSFSGTQTIGIGSGDGGFSLAGELTLTANSINLNGGTISGASTIFNGGTLSGVGTISGDLANNGGTVMPSGLLTVTGNCVQSAGSTRIDAGSTLAVGRGFTLSGGTISGNGTIQGDVLNGGTLTAGASPGTLTITGDYTQMSTGALGVELAGLTQGVTYDLLKISGNASLAGALNVALTGGFVPSSSDVFAIMTYANVSGNFTTFTGGFAGIPSSPYRLQLISDVAGPASTNRVLPPQCQ